MRPTPAWAGSNLPVRLAVHRERIARCVRHQYGDDPILRVLSEAVDRYGIPESELQMLVDGVEMDFTRTRYASFDELGTYCNLVASVVGRMCVRIFGFADPVALERADDLGMALQLTNILRDVREDANDLGRIYLPQDELARFCVSEKALFNGEIDPGWYDFVAQQVARARGYFESGYQVLRYIPRRPAACVATMAGIYEELLNKISRDPGFPCVRARRCQNGRSSWSSFGRGCRARSGRRRRSRRPCVGAGLEERGGLRGTVRA